MTEASLSPLDLGLAALLVLLNAGISLALSLGLARSLVIAGTRAVLQLVAVGLVLKAVFATASPWLTLLVALLMFGAAGWEVSSRQERRLAGWWGYGLGAGMMVAASTVVTLFALSLQLGAQPWYAPRIAIPLLGIVLGNAMNGVSLALNAFLGGVSRERAAIEAQLALGAERMTALRPFIARALRNALIPIINQMSAAGIITLPGMMTGQILAGMDPVEAGKYQALILFLLAGASGLGVLGATFAAAARITDERHRLRLDRLAVPAEH